MERIRRARVGGPSRMDESTEPSEATPASAAHRRRRFLVRTAIAVAALLIVILGLAAVSALGVRGHLQAGRDDLTRGRSAFVAGDVAHATQDFTDAGAAFRQAADQARSPWLSIAGAVPFLGRTPATVRAVADAGVETADAAAGLARAVADLPGGLGDLAPSASGIPLDHLAGLGAAMTRADRLTGDALAAIQATPTGLLLPSVASARDRALVQLQDIHRQLDAGAHILQGLPAFLGAGGPRHYFFGASNPAELRGTGGLIGAYSILTVNDGRLSFSPFRPVQSLPHLDVSQVPSPSPEFSSNFDFFRNGVGFWLNINMTPDYPLAAKAIWLAYNDATGQPLDGVIVADPFALQALMRVTGPIDVAQTGLKVTEKTVVPFVTNQAYALFKTNEQRKLVLGRVAESVLRSFLGRAGEPLARLRAVLAAFKDGHVKVWSADGSMEEGLALTSAGGAFRPSGSDAISVVTNSFSGTKLDFYQGRTVTYDVQLGPGGVATASLVAALANDSPTSGYPPYVIGPYKHFSTKPGENVALVHLYCAPGCELEGATEGDKPVQLRRFQEQGFPFYEDYVRTESGDTARIAADLLLPNAWTGSDTGGTYSLSFIGQTTIRPTTLHVVITPPHGMRFTSASDQLRRQGATLVYDGQPSGDLDLEASFAPSLPVRLWRDVLHLFG